MSHKCPQCGTEIRDSVKFCPECGSAQKARKQNQKKADSSPPKTAAKPSSSGMNIIYLVTLLAIVIVGIYGYRYVAPETGSDPHANIPRAVEPAQNSPFDQEHYQHLIEKVNAKPTAFDENVHLANFLFDNQRFEEAIKYYETALKANPRAADVMVDVGVSYFNINQIEKSKTYFENALNTNPQHINALYNMGVVSARLGNMQEMTQYWNRLIEVAPQSEQAQSAKQMLEQVRSSGNSNP
jgi:tetratricopeptide (TPR) repeat protein